MLSSISNSNRKKGPHHRPWIILFWFILLFALTAFLGNELLQLLPVQEAWKGKLLTPPSTANYVVSEVDTDHFDIYDVLYYGLGDAIQNAHKADVLLLGNSRVLFAFRDGLVQSFTHATGIRIFNLCFPANDGMVMAYETLRRQRLKPRIVVVNENDFFNHECSPYGLETLKEGKWRAEMTLWEHRVSWKVRLLLHEWLPRFDFSGIYGAVPHAAYQSSENGCLTAESFSVGREPVGLKESSKEGAPSSEELQTAKWFKEQMDQWGVQLVLTNIPYDAEAYIQKREAGTSLGALELRSENRKPFYRAVQLAKELKVPLVAPLLNGLQTIDGSHLTEESAKKFADQFFKDFSKIPEVKAISKKQPGAAAP